MSGICGVLRLDGAPSSTAELGPLLAPLKRRGPDGSQMWAQGPVALGHALLATTPEALGEGLPLHHAESGCTITADVRLDNRGELIRTLGLDAARPIGDGELILLAYLKWQDACVDHLLGDFAFALWDGRRQRLFCARDQLGMRQLTYWHRPRRAFLFATEAQALLPHPFVDPRLNPGRIADYLDDLEGSSLTETLYDGILRLPPAHILTASPTEFSVRRYWSLQSPPPLRLKSDCEYEAAFVDVFRDAVRARLRSPAPVAAMLSGGLDSTSVAAIAAVLLSNDGARPLRTISAVNSPSAPCVETRSIYAAAKIPGIDPMFVRCDELGGARQELAIRIRDQHEPFDRLLALERTVYLKAQQMGHKVVLDGVAGDLVLGDHSHTARLLRSGRIPAGAREAIGEARYWVHDWPAWRAFLTAAVRAWVPIALRSARRHAHWALQDRQIGRSGLISRSFALEARLHERRRQLRANEAKLDRLSDQERAWRIEHANLLIGREHYDRVAGEVGIEPRDPFMDLRVVNFCLSLPESQLQAGGWPKILLRRAMAGRVPDAVRWRVGKEHLGWEFVKAIFADPALCNVPQEIFRETIRPYVDLKRLPVTAGGGSVEGCKASFDAISLFHWLQSAGRGLGRSAL